MTHMLPWLLLLLAAGGSNAEHTPAAPASSRPAGGPPLPKGATIRVGPARVQKAAARPAAKAAAAQKPLSEEASAKRAAVDAVIMNALKTMSAEPPPAPQPTAATAAQMKQPVMAIDVNKRSPADAARALADYLKRTRKYGSKKNPVKEIADAQRDMGKLSVDGIYGPKTKARGKALGVALP